MTLAYDVQTLEPSGLVELFELDASILGGGVLYFHGYTQVGSVTWKGVEYSPWPIKVEGFEATTDQPPQPTLSVGNVDGSISILCYQFADMVGTTLTRRRTLSKYLDGQPEADPTQELPADIWLVERKSSEDKEIVQFELSSPMDFGGVQLPRRQIIANQCPWAYRSTECGYTGGPVAKIDDSATSDPALDRCGKRLSSCKLRFGTNGQLPFGGFPAAALIRT